MVCGIVVYGGVWYVVYQYMTVTPTQCEDYRLPGGQLGGPPQLTLEPLIISPKRSVGYSSISGCMGSYIIV